MVLFGYILHLCDQKCIHAAKLSPPLLKTRATHPIVPTQIGNGHNALHLIQNSHNLRVAISSSLYEKSP